MKQKERQPFVTCGAATTTNESFKSATVRSAVLLSITSARYKNEASSKLYFVTVNCNKAK